jgi:hypothetical protein
MRSDNSTTIVNSTIRDNSISGERSYGGGLFVPGAATITGSTIGSNRTSGFRGFGGGLTSTGTITLERSTVSGNRTTGTDSGGGGIHCVGALTIRDSTISGNSTGGNNADGGGLIAFAELTLEQATVSGNWTDGTVSGGGGIAVANAAARTITRSTVAYNRAEQFGSHGGGIATFGGDLHLVGSIVANNDALVSDDISIYPGGTPYADWSLIQQAVPGIVGANNIVGTSAHLEPLADNGGPTWTHALAPVSPALDAGDPEFAGPPAYDQRGFAFARVVGERIDIGAFEAGGVSADFDLDGAVTGNDFLVWQRGLGGAASHRLGDADLSGSIDAGDLDVWRGQMGTSAAVDVPPEETLEHAASAHQSASPSLSSDLVDAAMAYAAVHSDKYAPRTGRRFTKQPLD